MQVILLLFIILLGTVVPAQGTVLINEDFEVPDIQTLQSARGWQLFGNVLGSQDYLSGCIDPPPLPCSMDIVTITGHTGAPTNVLRFIYNGVWADDNHDARAIMFLGQPSAEIWERYWYKTAPVPPATSSSYTSGFMMDNPTKLHYFKVGGTTPDSLPQFITLTEPGFGASTPSFQLVQPAEKPGDAKNLLQNVGTWNFQDNQWVCVEMHANFGMPNVANAVFEMWVTFNGVTTQVASYQNELMIDTAHATAKVNSVTLFRQGATNMFRYEDDYQMATTRIGCGSSSLPPPPGQVQGVTAIPVVGSSSSIDIAWQAVVDATGIGVYNVQRAPGPACSAWVTITQINALTYRDTGLPASTQECYQVQAQDVLGQTGSFSSPPVTATTNANAAILPTTTSITTILTQATVVGTQDASNPAAFMRFQTDALAGSVTVPIAQVVGWPTVGGCGACTGIFTYNFSGGTFDCAHAQDATGTEDPVNFRCNPVAGGSAPSAPTNLQVH